MNRITYFPVDTQHQFATNQENIKGKPYEHYFNGDLWLHDEVMPAIRAAMDPSDAIMPDSEGLNSLLDPGYSACENGFCQLEDGTGYVASLVSFPGCTGAMYAWWFWWHQVEWARYTLWYPYNHVSATAVDPRVLIEPGLTDEQRYIGHTNNVDEYIGPDLYKIAIEFVPPADLGFDTSRFDDAGIVGTACALVSLRHPRLAGVTMVHLARQTDNGIEQRSRYWIGQDVAIEAFGRHHQSHTDPRSGPMDKILTETGAKAFLWGEAAAYEQLLHDQIEMTHLSTFLADIYGEFGNG